MVYWTFSLSVCLFFPSSSMVAQYQPEEVRGESMSQYRSLPMISNGPLPRPVGDSDGTSTLTAVLRQTEPGDNERNAQPFGTDTGLNSDVRTALHGLRRQCSKLPVWGSLDGLKGLSFFHAAENY